MRLKPSGNNYLRLTEGTQYCKQFCKVFPSAFSVFSPPDAPGGGVRDIKLSLFYPCGSGELFTDIGPAVWDSIKF